MKRGSVGIALLLGATACGSNDPAKAHPDGGHPTTDGAPVAVDAGVEGSLVDASARETAAEGGADAALSPTRFVASVVSFAPTACTGYGEPEMPGIVEGAPVGGGADTGSTDVVSLGSGGSIVLSFAPNAIVDGPGIDFLVFENPFNVGGNSSNVYAEPGEVSVSEDGVTWNAFPCAPAADPSSLLGTGVAPPYGQCAGWHPVLSTPQNGISPFDPAIAGGDPFDLADVGLTRATFVRIVDKTNEACPGGSQKPNDNGFDLDAVALVHAALP